MPISRLPNPERSSLLPEDRTCMVVLVPLIVTNDESQRAFDCLDTEERARSDRFVTVELRRRFGVCRGRLRMLLGAILETSPSKIAFKYGNLGKPYLQSHRDLHFNVSHSQDWAVMAFSRCSPVGVDIEFCNRRMNNQAIASQLLSEVEFSQWSLLPEANQRHALLSSWVAKEAILKSLGLGITTSLQKLVLPVPIPSHGFSPSIDAELIAKAESVDPFNCTHHLGSINWRLRIIEEVQNSIAAVCFESEKQTHETHHWNDLDSADFRF